jgi:hypothetical protein
MDWIYKGKGDQSFCMDWIKVFHRRPDGSEGFFRMDLAFSRLFKDLLLYLVRARRSFVT